jgi:hypothetical protein
MMRTTANICVRHPATNVRSLRSLGSRKIVLRAGRFAAATILALAVSMEGSGVGVRWRAIEMDSCPSGPSSCSYPASVIGSNPTTHPAIRYIWRKTVDVEDVIISALDRVADGFIISGRGDRSERLDRMHRIGRIGRVSRLDRIYPASIRSSAER